MKEYMFLFRGGDARSAGQSPEQVQAHMQKWVQWMDGIGKEGKFVSAQPLGSGGKQIAGNKKVVSDGPFMEGKEMIGGYMICKLDTYDEAVEIAKGCPIFEFDNGNVEIREIQAM